jgi:STE24 endopeptidase
MTTTQITPVVADSLESRRYNRIKRWLGFADAVIGFVLLAVLLATGWTGWLRDLAERGAWQNYSFAVFLYVLMLMLISKAIGLPLEYYGFRLEHRYNLSNQKFRSWLWDECKSFLVGLALAGIVVELLYMLMRETPQHWWLIAWAVFLGFAVLLAQLAPVVLFPMFYKFEPLENEELKRRLIVLSERAGTRVRGVYKWHLSEKARKPMPRSPASAPPGASFWPILCSTITPMTRLRLCSRTNWGIMCTATF